MNILIKNKLMESTCTCTFLHVDVACKKAFIKNMGSCLIHGHIPQLFAFCSLLPLVKILIRVYHHLIIIDLLLYLLYF